MGEIYKAADEFVECMQVLWKAEEDWLFSKEDSFFSEKNEEWPSVC